MRIPKSVPICGHHIKVTIYPPELWVAGDDCVGLWDPQANEISLHGSLSGSKLEQVFYHELVHACLTMLSHRLAYSEVFVDQFASLLHQALSGAKYSRKAKQRTVMPAVKNGRATA